MKTFSRASLRYLPAIMLLAIISAVQADDHEHRQHGAHQHGVAQLNIVLEGDALEIELASPAMNIVGFEHKPENHQQEHQLNQAVSRLRMSEQVFTLPAAAACVLAAAQVESGLLEGEGAHQHQDQHVHEGHADFDADYRFTCANPAALTHVDVQLFKLFPATEEIEVQLISPAGQRALELNPQSVRLQLQ